MAGRERFFAYCIYLPDETYCTECPFQTGTRICKLLGERLEMRVIDGRPQQVRPTELCPLIEQGDD
jgi:hypothetical protein